VLAEMGSRLDLPVTVPQGRPDLPVTVPHGRPDLPVTVPKRPTRLRLADFLRRRRQLVEIRKAEKVRRHNAGQDEIVEDIEAMIDLPSARIDDSPVSRHTPTIAANGGARAASGAVGERSARRFTSLHSRSRGVFRRCRGCASA
jgi:hypothetical protein